MPYKKLALASDKCILMIIAGVMPMVGLYAIIASVVMRRPATEAAF